MPKLYQKVLYFCSQYVPKCVWQLLFVNILCFEGGGGVETIKDVLYKFQDKYHDCTAELSTQKIYKSYRYLVNYQIIFQRKKSLNFLTQS